MGFSKLSAVVLSALYGLRVAAQLSSCPQPDFTYTPPQILPGYSLTKLADNFTHPRQIVVDNRNNLIISSLGEGLIGLQTKFSKDGCPSVTHQKIIVPDNGLNFSHAVILSADQKTLFASTPDKAFSWEYDSETLSVKSKAKVIVKNMFLTSPEAITRALGIPREYPNLLMVFRNEDSDSDPFSAEITGGRSVIKFFDLNRVPKDGYDFVKDGTIFAWGVRDSLEYVQDSVGNFWNVDNGADVIVRVDPKTGANTSIGLDNPADEINLLGKLCPDQPSDKAPNFGFPECHAVWNGSELVDNTLDLHIGDTFSVNPKEFSDEKCLKTTVAPRLSLFPHSAPLGLKFYSPRNPSLGEELVDSAFVSYHGPTGHKIVVVPFSHGTVAAPPTTDQGTFDFIWTDKSINLENCKSEIVTGPTAVDCLSPVGLAFDENGVLYFTSDQTGEVFAVTKDTSAI